MFINLFSRVASPDLLIRDGFRKNRARPKYSNTPQFNNPNSRLTASLKIHNYKSQQVWDNEKLRVSISQELY